MIIGAFYLMFKSFYEIGGYAPMINKFGYSVANTTLFSNSTCGIPPKDYNNLMRALDSDITWLGIQLYLFLFLNFYKFYFFI